VFWLLPSGVLLPLLEADGAIPSFTNLAIANGGMAIHLLLLSVNLLKYRQN